MPSAAIMAHAGPIAIAQRDTHVKSIHVSDIEATFGSTTIGLDDRFLRCIRLILIDLISKPLGSRIVGCSDEWFADAANLITPTPPVRKAGVYVHSGAWFDGWETKRHNPNSFDWAVIKLGVAGGTVQGIEIDTAFFNGNEAPAIGVEGCYAPDATDDELKVAAQYKLEDPTSPWVPLIAKVDCGPSQRHAWQLSGPITQKNFTHVRLLMFPDGGIARFRLYGTAIPIFPIDQTDVFDLAAATMGARAISCSDQHFGRKENLILPGRGVDMGDGWETARSRAPGHYDWAIIKLGTPGIPESIVIDTAHFRGNYPQSVSISGLMWREDRQPGPDESGWADFVTKQPCQADYEHTFKLLEAREVTHLKLVIFPDGGVKRIRAFGRRLLPELGR
jgi:allantoicase